MMKTTNKTFLLIICLTVFIFLTPLPKSNVLAAEDDIDYIEPYELYIDDEADLLTDVEEEMLYRVMEPIGYSSNVVFYTTDYGYEDTEQKCISYCAKRYSVYETDPVVMFTIDMANREIYLFCTGDIRHSITNADALTITDNIYTYATKGDYYTCAAQAFEQAAQLLDGASIKRPMKLINNVLIALFLGFFLNFLLMKFGRTRIKKQNTVPKATKILHPSVQATVKSRATRTYRYTESSSSSGGGGGFSGGGGGGGHSGGGHSF